jgi:hypothetical protein
VAASVHLVLAGSLLSSLIASSEVVACCLAGDQQEKNYPKEKPKDEPKLMRFLGREEEVEKNCHSLLSQIRFAESAAVSLLFNEEAFKKQPKSAYQAILFLGEIRSTRAVPHLCDRLLYEVGPPGVVSRTWKQQYPAAMALVQIGTIGADGLLAKIGGGETSEDYRKVATKVLIAVHGKKDVMQAIDSFRGYDPARERTVRPRLHDFKKELKAQLE